MKIYTAYLRHDKGEDIYAFTSKSALDQVLAAYARAHWANSNVPVPVDTFKEDWRVFAIYAANNTIDTIGEAEFDLTDIPEIDDTEEAEPLKCIELAVVILPDGITRLFAAATLEGLNKELADFARDAWDQPGLPSHYPTDESLIHAWYQTNTQDGLTNRPSGTALWHYQVDIDHRQPATVTPASSTSRRPRS